MSILLYRSGPIMPNVKRGIEAQSYINADTCKPAGTQGRYGAIFSSLSIAENIRWVRGNHLSNFGDITVREMAINNPDGIYAYSVHAWEKASGKDNYGDSSEDFLGRIYKPYWGTRVPLNELINSRAKFDNNLLHSNDSWEVLLPFDKISSVKELKYKDIEPHITELFKKEIRGYYR